MKLRELMSPITITHSANESLNSVLNAIADRHYSCAIVCEYEKPIGIITERDIVRIAANGGINDTVTVGELMTKEPICVSADTELLEALDLCESRSLRHLPVVDNTQRLIGVITQTDLVKAHAATFEASDKLKEQNRKLHILAVEDPLTGLPNRRAMEIDIKHAAALAQRHGAPYSIALIDIDVFKSFNDRYGHQAGDRAIVKIADLLRSNMRASDKIFRYGGEEFLFLMPLTALEGAAIATQRICDKISACNYPHEVSELGFLSVSIGVASSYTNDWQRAIEDADSALYDAKDAGRNQICLAPCTQVTEFWDLSKRSDQDRRIPN
ncbi:MAG: diguanylate cyclase (GGDEF)-like protein [Pseudohongiellaceae bacterium]|jgi:diguanylate cyclase (GGDEF)-like protein